MSKRKRKASPSPSEESPPGKKEVPAWQEKAKQYMSVFSKAVGIYEKAHPHLMTEVLLWLTDSGLRTLRHHIESDSEGEPTWRNPHAEFQFPVDCAWQDYLEKGLGAKITMGQFVEKDFANDGSARKALTKLMVKFVEVETLRFLTNQVAFQKEGETWFPAMPEHVALSVESIEDKIEREGHLRSLFEPCSFGGGTVDFDEDADGNPLADSPRVVDRLCSIRKPLISIPFQIGEHSFSVITVLEIRPLKVDTNTRKAYFPLLVGLAIQGAAGQGGSLDWHDGPWACFSRWPETFRTELWDVLHETVKQSLLALFPTPEPEMVEAVLSVNAEIRIKVPKGDSSMLAQAKADLLGRLQATGEVVSIGMQSSVKYNCDTAAQSELEMLLKLVEEGVNTDAKGKALEALVARLFESVEGFKVEARVKTQTEEIDLVVINEFEKGPFRHEQEIILVECKNWACKCGKNEFVVLREKMANRGGRCSLGFLISWNGFCQTITKEQLRGSKENILVVPIDGAELRKAVTESGFFPVLVAARRRSQMI